MSRATDPRTGAAGYRLLLERLEAWFARARDANPGVIPCQGGCSACCHGPFDISVADLELLREGLAALEPQERDAVEVRARALLERIEALEPLWRAPYDIAAIGEERFDRLSETLATEPCPMLDEAGRCRIYDARPLVCRLVGLGMVTPAGRVIENACPIQGEFPAYAALRPLAFDLEDFEVEEWEALQGAARRLFGSTAYHDFETTIAAAVAGRPETGRAERGRTG